MKLLSLTGLALAALTTLVLPTAPGLRAQTYQPGVFVATSEGPVSLTAWAELVRQDGLGDPDPFRSGHQGPLEMVQGQLDEAPVVADVVRLIVKMNGFSPAAVMVSTSEYFSEGHAERRAVPTHVQRRGLWTFEVRAADMEQPAGVHRLLETVRASEEAPGYFFVVVGGHQTMLRFYPFRVR